MSTEATELYFWTVNTESFSKRLQYIENSLKKKIKKEIFSAKLAEKAFYTTVTEASKLYCKYFGGIYYQIFTVKTRREVCKNLVENFLNECE